MQVTEKQYARRLDAVKLADAINKIEGVPVSDEARRLSDQWARGEITADEMKAGLIAAHKRRSLEKRL